MVTYQRLTDKELDTFIQMRIRQLREEGATEEIDLVPHLKDYHWSEEKSEQEIEDDIAYFMNHGMSRKEAEDYCRKQNGIIEYLKKNAGKTSLTKTNGYMISYGWK